MKNFHKTIGWIFLSILVVSCLSCNNEQIAENAQPLVQITVSSTDLRFGEVESGRTIDQTVVITNSFSFTKRLTGTISINGAGFTILGDTTSLDLAPGESRTITVRFSPTSGGSYSGSLTIVHNALNTSDPITIKLSGSSTSSGSASIVVSRTSLDFGTVGLGQSLSRTITISSPSNSTGSINGNVSISGSAFSILSGGGTFTLAAGESISVAIMFTPSSTGSFSGMLSITHDASNTSTPITVTLTGSGGSAGSTRIEVSRVSIDFGTVMEGHPTDQSFTITNPSISIGTLTGTVIIVGGQFSLTTGAGTYSLSPGESKTVTIEYSAASPGAASGIIQIIHNATNTSSPVFVSLRGQSLSSIIISADPTSLNFGVVTVGNSSQQSLVLSNSANSTEVLSGRISLAGTAFTIVNGGGFFNIPPGQTRTVTIAFSPPGNAFYSGSILIDHNATSTSSPLTIPVSGSGQWRITLLVDPSTIDFGGMTVGRFEDTSITITNASTSLENITGTVRFGLDGAGFSFISGSGSFNLSPGRSKTVRVRFSPQTTGQYGGSVDIWHNAQNVLDPFSVSLDGSGEPPVINISVTPTVIEFGTLSTGQSTDQTVTISNLSTSTGALKGSVGISGTGFSLISGAGSYSLDPGQSLDVKVRFSPTAATSYFGFIKILHNATSDFNPSLVSLSGSSR